MGQINKITVKGFKSILDQEIALGRLNVFIGTNGAGKSNLLEAVAMLSASVEGGIDYERLSRRGARLSSPEVFRSSLQNHPRGNTFKLALSTDSIQYDIEIQAQEAFTYQQEQLFDLKTQKSLLNRTTDRMTASFGKSSDDVFTLFETAGSLPILKSLNQRPLDLKKLENFAIYAPSSPILRGVATDNSNKAPLGLYGGRLAEALKEIGNGAGKDKDLQRFFELLDWFQAVETTEHTDSKLISEYVSVARNVVKYKDKFMAQDFNDLYAYDVSEGALYILFVLVLLAHPRSPDFFALDNIDSALNPGLVRNLMGHIAQILEKEPNKQVMLTTHNPTTLDALDLFNPEHRLFVVSRGEDGQTIVETIEPPKGMTKASWQEKYHGLKLSEIWLSGAIGGLTQGF